MKMESTMYTGRTNIASHTMGFTLIEMLVYLALFSFIMTSAFAGAYQIIEHGNRTRSVVLRIEEEHFIIRKISSVINSSTAILDPDSNGSVLTIEQQDGERHRFELKDTTLYMDDEPLSNDIVAVRDFFVARNVSPEIIEISFMIDDKRSSTSTFRIR